MFQSTLPTRGSDICPTLRSSSFLQFQSTLPTRGSDVGGLFRYHQRDYVSIHAPHEGERRADNERCYKGLQFQSTLPTRGSDWDDVKQMREQGGFNPRSPRGGATRGVFKTEGKNIVSIHAPHEGERPKSPRRDMALWPFQSTLPTRGSDNATRPASRRSAKFQSTLPTRGSDNFALYDSQ